MTNVKIYFINASGFFILCNFDGMLWFCTMDIGYEYVDNGKCVVNLSS